MKYERAIGALRSYQPPVGWPAHIFLLPEPVMHDIYNLILEEKPACCIELGTGFGATSCVMAAALDELGAARLVTIDLHLPELVNVNVLMQHAGIDASQVQVVVDPLGYNWYLADVIRQQSRNGVCTPLYDFCLLDGAHEWQTDALAFTLVAKLLRPGAWIAIDDLNFNLRLIPNWKASHPNYTDREIDTFQMAMVYELMVLQHPDFGDYRITHDGRIGWARKLPMEHLRPMEIVAMSDLQSTRSSLWSRAMTTWRAEGGRAFFSKARNYLKRGLSGARPFRR